MPVAARKSKGERTAERILDAAEALFAERGFGGTSLRAIARDAGIQEPGVYNHFASKQQLYAAVLDRALSPMADAMNEQPGRRDPLHSQTLLPARMTDLLLEHPKMAALFQQALQGDRESIGNQLIQGWLDRLFAQGLETLDSAGSRDVDRSELAIQTIAMFNLTTGYFLSQRALESMVDGAITDPANIARQKKLLGRIARAMQSD